jgi:GNAT superfamily N-acetyltransferase
VRVVRPDDVELFRKGCEHLSTESRCARFLSAKSRLTQIDLACLTETGGIHHFAIGAVRLDSAGRGTGLGVSRFVRIAHGLEVAEPVVTVVDDDQGIGLGGALLAGLIEAARERGSRSFGATSSRPTRGSAPCWTAPPVPHTSLRQGAS